MNHVALLGLAAACCTTFAFVPQVVRIWRTRSANDISLLMFVVLSTGLLLWLVYGLLVHDLPIVLANAVTLLLALTILVLKLRR
jgi:MtN3 and saliva related transmembrane protein